MKKEYTIGLLLLVIAIVGVLIYFSRSGYEVDLKLTPEQIAEYTEKVDLMDKRIKTVTPPEKPDIDLFVEKARYLEYLGKYGKAIDVLLESFKYYENTSVGWNNIAKLYDKKGDYKSAIVFYTKLVETFDLNAYYLSLAWDYYRLEDIPKAREAYGRYVQFTSGQDLELIKLFGNPQ
ncbi:MAG: hypothetical protein AAB606_05105 [Patescibacteria group bacterium]